MNKTYKELKALPPQQWVIFRPAGHGFLSTVGGVGDIFDAKRMSKREALLLEAPPEFTAMNITEAIRKHYEMRGTRDDLFEGQERYVPYFMEQHFDGRGEVEPVVRTQGGKYVTFTITLDDIAWFPELAGRDRVVLDYYGTDPNWLRITEVRNV